MTTDLAQDPRARLSGLARIALSGLIWGTIPLMTRSADGATSVKVFYRMLFAGITVGTIMLANGSWRELVSLPAAKWRQVSFQGVLLTVNWFLFFGALDRTNVATAELLGYMGPIFVAILAPFVTREAFDRRIVVPLLCALGGIVIILAPQGIGVSSRTEMIGALMAFASALTYAALLLRSKKILRGISSSSLMMIEYIAAIIILSPFVAVAYARGDVPSSGRAYLALVVLGIVQTALSGFTFLSGLRRVRTDHAAVLMYVEPASAVIFAALFLSEPLTWTTIAGGLMVVAGGTLVARLESRDIEPMPLEATSLDSGHAERDEGMSRE